MTSVNDIVKKLEAASEAYYLNTPIISDAEFDSLADRLRELDPEHPFLARVGAIDIQTTPWPIVKHPRAMGSLNKVNTKEEFMKFASKGQSGTFCASDKAKGPVRYCNTRKLFKG